MAVRLIEIAKTPRRNEPCLCGSGKKYKKCCMLLEASGAAKLSSEDTDLFFRINMGLMGHVAKTENKVMVLDSPNDMREFQEFTTDMREICWKQPETYITEYLRINEELGEREHAILEDWLKKYIMGDFFIMDFKPAYTVVMHVDYESKKGTLYGIKGLTDSLAHVVKRQKPIAAKMILLPFEGKIVYDGILNYLKSDFSEHEVESLTDIYNSILEDEGVVMEL